jgi:ribonuclease P protein component
MSVTPHFTLRVTQNEALKVIISISKKVSKKAVIRNRIRRRIRPILSTFKLLPASYLLVVKPGSEEVKGEELRVELASLLKKS